MAGEFRHGSVGTDLTQAEWEALAAHAFDAQATGDILYASSATQLSKLDIGSAGQILAVSGGIPAWQANLTFNGTTLTLGQGQIAFPATQVASAGANTLDDYEEGSLTLGIADATLDGSGEGQTYSGNTGGFYTKIGNRVLVNGDVQISGLGTLTTTEGASITGLPFVLANVVGGHAGVAFGYGESLAITANQAVTGFASSNTTTINLQLWDAAAGTTSLLVSEVSVDGRFLFETQYRV